MVFNLSSREFDYDFDYDDQYTWFFYLCPRPKKNLLPERVNLPYYD